MPQACSLRCSLLEIFIGSDLGIGPLMDGQVWRAIDTKRATPPRMEGATSQQTAFGRRQRSELALQISFRVP